MVIQKYYELTDKPSTEVNGYWKGLQIIAYAVAAITGYALSYVFGVTRDKFGPSCILFPNLNFTIKHQTNISEDGVTNTIIRNFTLNIDDTVWGDEKICDFCQYVPIMSMVLATVMLVFFVISPKGGSNVTQMGIKDPHQMVIPCLILSIIFLIIMIIAANKLGNGLEAFCAEFKPVFNTTRCIPEIGQFVTKGKTDDNSINYILLSMILPAYCVGAWVSAIVILILRILCVVDFNLVEVTVSRVEKEPIISATPVSETEVVIEPIKNDLEEPNHV